MPTRRPVNRAGKNPGEPDGHQGTVVVVIRERWPAAIGVLRTCRPLRRGEHDVLGAVLGVEETVSEGAAPSCCGAGGGLFRVEGVVESVAEGATESDQIRMQQGVGQSGIQDGELDAGYPSPNSPESTPPHTTYATQQRPDSCR